MATSLERSPPGGLGRLALIAVAFGLLAPAPLFALPLAALLVFSRKETRAEVVTAGLAGGLSLWWLLLPGNLPGQVLRTGLLFSTATLVAASPYSRASFPPAPRPAPGFPIFRTPRLGGGRAAHDRVVAAPGCRQGGGHEPAAAGRGVVRPARDRCSGLWCEPGRDRSSSDRADAGGDPAHVAR